MEAHLRISEALDPIQQRIYTERPDIFIGAALSDEPGGPPTIYIKGPADEWVRNLVATAGIEIVIVDNQPFSEHELNEREMRVADALQVMGFANFAVGSLLEDGGRMYAEITRQGGLPDDPGEILERLPTDLRDWVEVTLSREDVVVPQ
jgi:hypothetical protein